MRRFACFPAVLLGLAAGSVDAQEVDSHVDLLQSAHIHGLVADPQDQNRVLLATHNGLFAYDFETEDFLSIGESRQDFMGLSVGGGGRFFASGHPEAGGNSGVLLSTDGGVSWTMISEGVDRQVDFHQLTASPADPATLYGAFAGGLERSRDAGRTWELVGPAPNDLIDLAGSTIDAETLYAATEAGLLKSENGGRTWSPAHPATLPVSFVETGPGGSLYAFIVGHGLVRADEESLNWTPVSDPLGDEDLLSFATDGTRALAATSSGVLLVSDTGGESWDLLGD